MAVLCLKALLFVVYLFGVLLSLTSGQAEVPTTDEVWAWARKLKTRLVNDEWDVKMEGLLRQGYQHMDGGKYRVLDGGQIVQGMAEELAAGFAHKVTALRKLKEAAENAVLRHRYDSDLASVDYYDMNETAGGRHGFEVAHERRFGQPVNLTASGVHIPLEIYRGDSRILNGLNWSAALDPVFRGNYDPERRGLAWQFFGSRDGFMRVYPANRWKLIPDMPDLFDVRNRPWYIQGSTSPKDMLVMMDVSGSVHGQTFEIMKIAVKTLLDTLEEDDYVNVAWFSDRAGFATCFRTFVQANSRNKRRLFDGIDDLRAANMASYTRAFEFAFEHFRNFSESKREYEGAECHRVIMFFTDGGTERADDVFRRYNADRGVRVFAYAVGPHAVPVHTIRAMACQNRGFFDTVSAMGAVRSKVQQYPNVLGRPMALADNETESYSTVYTDAGGLGLVVTVTLPVYNRSSESGNQTTVGVVGIDTPVGDIAAALPAARTGPNAYPFAVNPNGFVILHPRMRPTHTYLADAPDVDFLDLEGGDPSQEAYVALLRKDMIDGRADSKQYRMYVETGDPYHILQENVTYHFAPVAATTISLGVAVPSDRTVYIDAGGGDIRDLRVDDGEGILLAPWNFCPNMTDHEGWDPAENVLWLRAEIRVNSSRCDPALLRRLALDVEQTNGMHMYLKRIQGGASGFQDDLRAAIFVGTEGGLMRVFPPTAATQLRRLADPYKATYYKKGLHYTDWAFFVSLDDDAQERTVTAVKAVTVGNIVLDGKTYSHRPAVYGVRLHERGLHDLLGGLEVGGFACRDPDQLNCYLLDDGGYVVASNGPDHAAECGQFLGRVDAPLMWHLNAKSVYKRRLEYDYHAVCTRTDTRTSAAPLLQTAFHALMDAALWILLSGWTTLSAGDVTVPVRVANYSCTKVRALYYFTPLNEAASPAPVDGQVACGNCTRPFSAVRIQQSNLLLVVAAPAANCPTELCGRIELMHQPQETKGPDVCEMEPRYRRRPMQCFANHSAEDTSECSAAGHWRMTPFVAAALLLAWLALAPAP